MRPLHGDLDAKNVGLKLLISDAYGVEAFHISGGPAWIDADRFDIEAKAGGDATGKQMMPMLQSLLEDRFKLKAHRETREEPVFDLTLAKSGIKLQPLKEGSCVPADPNSPPRPPAPGQKPPCGAIRPGMNAMDAVGANMAALTRVLTLILGRTVIDKAGVAGPFDVLHLEYAREDLTGNRAVD